MRMAGAILDFWTTDWVALAEKLRKDAEFPAPELLERPILKLGTYLFQLPWHLGLQNNSAAAINNLRRIGARRGEYAEENRRIEERLARQFESRGFTVALNWNPPSDDPANAGEVDLICARDGGVLVIELKSTYIRRTQRDAWLHAAMTLRKAGRQVQRKVAAVDRALASNSDLATSLHLKVEGISPGTIGWIVDTSIEHDHQPFSGYLKVSLEEVLIALRDDHGLLNDPAQLLGNTKGLGTRGESCDTTHEVTLYPAGFDFKRFVEVVESEAVWNECLAMGAPG
jgi:Holliday junction resolvase-like predicted endonuclease